MDEVRNGRIVRPGDEIIRKLNRCAYPLDIKGDRELELPSSCSIGLKGRKILGGIRNPVAGAARKFGKGIDPVSIEISIGIAREDIPFDASR